MRNPKPIPLPRDQHRALLVERLRAALERRELIGIGEYTDALEWIERRETEAEELAKVSA